MPLGRNHERRTNNDERKPMTDRPKNLSFLTPTSVINSMDSISYHTHILTPLFRASAIPACRSLPARYGDVIMVNGTTPRIRGSREQPRLRIG